MPENQEEEFVLILATSAISQSPMSSLKYSVFKERASEVSVLSSLYRKKSSETSEFPITFHHPVKHTEPAKKRQEECCI